MNTQTTSTLPQGPRAASSASAAHMTLTGASSATGLRSASGAAKRLKEAQSPAQASQSQASQSQASQSQAQELLAQGLLALPAQVVSSLPAPVTLRLNVPGAPVPVVLWTGRIQQASREATPVLAEVVMFDGAELDAIVCACEADRLWHADFLGLCFEKWRRPEVPVRTAELLDGANPDQNASWTLSRVLTRLGLEVETIELDEREPVARSLYEAA